MDYGMAYAAVMVFGLVTFFVVIAAGAISAGLCRNSAVKNFVLTQPMALWLACLLGGGVFGMFSASSATFYDRNEPMGLEPGDTPASELAVSKIIACAAWPGYGITAVIWNADENDLGLAAEFPHTMMMANTMVWIFYGLLVRIILVTLVRWRAAPPLTHPTI